MNSVPDLHELPVLTDVIEYGPGIRLRGEPTSPAASDDLPSGDWLGAPPALDLPALERHLTEELMRRFENLLQERVHASVAPAVSLLADRIAYKAAQEVAGDLAERLRDDLEAAVRLAVEEAVRGRR